MDSRTSSLTRNILHQQFQFLDENPGSGEVVEALYDFVPQRGDELPLIKGDKIRVIGRESSDWWEGVIMGTEIRGYFPTNYIKKKVESKEHGKFEKDREITEMHQDEENQENEENHYETISKNGDTLNRSAIEVQ